MTIEIESYYEHLKNFSSEFMKRRTKTVSTQDFKKKALNIYEEWKTKIEPILDGKIKGSTLRRMNRIFEGLYKEAGMREADVSHVKSLIKEINDLFLKEVITSLRKVKIREPEASMVESASFLGLDSNWSSATCALQLQEVAITLVAKKKGIKLDKPSVESILGKRIPKLTFNDQYGAFSTVVKQFNVEMPILATHLRRMRVKVLHEGYNPKPEETESIVRFTIGFLERLKRLMD